MSWKTYRLGDILERKRVSVKIEKDELYKLVTIKLYHQGVIMREEKKGDDIKSNMFYVNTGDFILSGIDARNGAFGIVPKELDGAIVTNDFWILEPNPEIMRKDFFLFITSTPLFDYICKQCSDGTTQRIRLQRDKFYDYELSLPSIDEQQLLVHKLTNYNQNSRKLSDELTHQLTLVKQLRQSFLREAMQGKLVAQNPADGNAKDLLVKIKAEKAKSGKKEKPLPAIKEEEIPFEIPESWVWCRLGEITNYGTSLKADPTDLKEDTWVLDLEDIEKESSKLIEKKRFKERNSLSTKSRFIVGDVLYSKLRPYLDKVIVADEIGVCTTEILPLKCFAEMNPFFLRYSLKREDFLLYVNSVTKGMKMPRLGTKEGELALIPLPPFSEQQAIVSKLDELMLMCDELEQSIKSSQEQNEKLLQQVLREALRG